MPHKIVEKIQQHSIVCANILYSMLQYCSWPGAKFMLTAPTSSIFRP